MPAKFTAPKTFLRDIKLPSILDPAPPGQKSSATKVICTLGPACRDVDTLVEMLEAGMTAARVDLTWGGAAYHVQSLKNLAKAMQRTKLLCATIVDTVGREVLVRSEFTLDQTGWPAHKEGISIEAGQDIRLTHDPDAQLSDTCLPVSYPFELLAQPGDTFFVGRYLASGAEDSSVWLDVTRLDGPDIICEAKNAAILSGLLTVLHAAHPDRGGGLNFTELPVLSEHDVAALRSIAESGVDIDFLALTFTRSSEDIREARSLLDELHLPHVKVLAKVEDAAALYEFDGIAAAADGVILSRGNLGLDVAPEKMARVQKSVIGASNLLGTPIVITRIMDSMTISPRPTRAEATDVANAVLDGADAFLLGAETLRGRYPVATVEVVTAICRQAEGVFDHEAVFDNIIAAQAADGEDQRGLYLGSPDQSMASLPGEGPRHASPRPAVGIESGHPALVHGLPSVASVGRLHRLNDAHAPAASRTSLAALAASEAKRSWRLDSVASTAVRAAAKIKARLIIVYAHSGRTASLVAKYRPEMPVIALMVPRLIQNNLRWQLHGLSAARQTLITRGVVPMLGAPMAGASHHLLKQAVLAAAARDMVGPNDHVVCILSERDDLVVQALSVSELGIGFEAETGEPPIFAEPAAPNRAALQHTISFGHNGSGDGAAPGGVCLHAPSSSPLHLEVPRDPRPTPDAAQN